MPELREVFEVTTKQMGEPDLDAWREQQERQREANRSKKIGAFAIAAAIVVVAVVMIIGTRESQDTTTPADQATVNPPGKTAVDVATDFFNAYGFFHNDDQAVSMLADDADLSGLGLYGTREFRLLMRFTEATGNKQILDSCEEAFNYSRGTVVRCTWDFHALRSDEIGRGPYSGSYDEITVRDGEVVDVNGYIDTSKFSPQMWDPFAAWITTNYPDDIAVMYKAVNLNPLGDYRLTPESIRLWEQHTLEYVKAVKQGTA
jgi:hypothetical protein